MPPVEQGLRVRRFSSADALVRIAHRIERVQRIEQRGVGAARAIPVDRTAVGDAVQQLAQRIVRARHALPPSVRASVSTARRMAMRTASGVDCTSLAMSS